jgi:hypothetical protein
MTTAKFGVHLRQAPQLRDRQFRVATPNVRGSHGFVDNRGEWIDFSRSARKRDRLLAPAEP